MNCKDAARHFQLELPFMEFIFDQACETLSSRVIRICDYYFPAVHEQASVVRNLKNGVKSS